MKDIENLYLEIAWARLNRDPLYQAWRDGKPEDYAKILSGAYNIPLDFAKKYKDVNIRKIVERSHGVILEKRSDGGISCKMRKPLSVAYNINSTGAFRIKFDLDLTMINWNIQSEEVLRAIKNEIGEAIAQRDKYQRLPFNYTPKDIRRDLELLSAYENANGNLKVTDSKRKALRKIEILVYGERPPKDSASFPCEGCKQRDSKKCPCPQCNAWISQNLKMRSFHSGLGGTRLSYEEYAKNNECKLSEALESKF